MNHSGAFLSCLVYWVQFIQPRGFYVFRFTFYLNPSNKSVSTLRPPFTKLNAR